MLKDHPSVGKETIKEVNAHSLHGHSWDKKHNASHSTYGTGGDEVERGTADEDLSAKRTTDNSTHHKETELPTAAILNGCLIENRVREGLDHNLPHAPGKESCLDSTLHTEVYHLIHVAEGDLSVLRTYRVTVGSLTGGT